MTSPLEPTPAVIMAGGRARPELEAVIGTPIRAMALVGGETLLSLVLNALEAGGCSPIVVVGEVPTSPRYTQVDDTGAFVTNLFAALDAAPEAPYLLVSTADLPYLTGESVADFIRGGSAEAAAMGAGIACPVISIDQCNRQFPGVKRTAIKVKEGAYTTGNLMLVRPECLRAQRSRIETAYGARKSPLRLAGMLGFGTIVRMIASQTLSPRFLTIPLLQERVSRLLGGPACAYMCRYAEIATDIDRPSDFEAIYALEAAERKS